MSRHKGKCAGCGLEDEYTYRCIVCDDVVHTAISHPACSTSMGHEEESGRALYTCKPCCIMEVSDDDEDEGKKEATPTDVQDESVQDESKKEAAPPKVQGKSVQDESKKEAATTNVQDKSKKEAATTNVQHKSKKEAAPTDVQDESKKEEAPPKAHDGSKKEAAPTHVQDKSKKEAAPPKAQDESKKEAAPANVQDKSEKEAKGEQPAHGPDGSRWLGVVRPQRKEFKALARACTPAVERMRTECSDTGGVQKSPLFWSSVTAGNAGGKWAVPTMHRKEMESIVRAGQAAAREVPGYEKLEVVACSVFWTEHVDMHYEEVDVCPAGFLVVGLGAFPGTEASTYRVEVTDGGDDTLQLQAHLRGGYYGIQPPALETTQHGTPVGTPGHFMCRLGFRLPLTATKTSKNSKQKYTVYARPVKHPSDVVPGPPEPQFIKAADGKTYQVHYTETSSKSTPTPSTPTPTRSSKSNSSSSSDTPRRSNSSSSSTSSYEGSKLPLGVTENWHGKSAQERIQELIGTKAYWVPFAAEARSANARKDWAADIRDAVDITNNANKESLPGSWSKDGGGVSGKAVFAQGETMMTEEFRQAVWQLVREAVFADACVNWAHVKEFAEYTRKVVLHLPGVTTALPSMHDASDAEDAGAIPEIEAELRSKVLTVRDDDTVSMGDVELFMVSNVQYARAGETSMHTPRAGRGHLRGVQEIDRGIRQAGQETGRQNEPIDAQERGRRGVRSRRQRVRLQPAGPLRQPEPRRTWARHYEPQRNGGGVRWVPVGRERRRRALRVRVRAQPEVVRLHGFHQIHAHAPGPPRAPRVFRSHVVTGLAPQ